MRWFVSLGHVGAFLIITQQQYLLLLPCNFWISISTRSNSGYPPKNLWGDINKDWGSWVSLNLLAGSESAPWPRYEFQAVCHQFKAFLGVELDDTLCVMTSVQVDGRAKNNSKQWGVLMAKLKGLSNSLLRLGHVSYFTFSV